MNFALYDVCISTKPVIETLKQALQGQSRLVEFYSKNTDWERHLQCQVFLEAKVIILL